MLNELSTTIEKLRIRAHDEGMTPEEGFALYKDLLPESIKYIDEPYATGINCAGYALDLGRTTSQPYGYIDKYFEESESFDSADIYVLLRTPAGAEEDLERDWLHLGKVLADGSVISKWGWDEPVFEGPLEFYPGTYTKIRFYRRIKKDPTFVV